MGQYYRALLISDDGNINIGVPYDFDNGYKLMEHSWIGNSFVDAVAEMLYEQPMRLAWIGDYATDLLTPYEFGSGYIKSKKEFIPFYHLAWDDEGGKKRITKESVNQAGIKKPYDFIINETKGCFIDINKYINVNKENDGWCIHPLPLLTSIGNGLGGGDFRAEYVGIENVGTWAFDRISTSNLRPCNIEEVEYRFAETEQEDIFPF